MLVKESYRFQGAAGGVGLHVTGELIIIIGKIASFKQGKSRFTCNKRQIRLCREREYTFLSSCLHHFHISQASNIVLQSSYKVSYMYGVQYTVPG